MKKAKTPYTTTGHRESSSDPAAIRFWWMQHPRALVGVNAGASGLVCADIDMGEDSNGKPHDGWASLVEQGLDDLPDTFNYETRRGGSHYIYEPVDGRPLGPTQNHVTPQGVTLTDVDRRAGSSYFIWWGSSVPVARDEFAPAPDWLLTEATEPEVNPFSGTVEEWLEKCTAGAPSPLVREWITCIPDRDFGHMDMITMQASLVHLGIQGEPGIPTAIEALRDAWLRDPYNTEQYRYDFESGLTGAIAKYGSFGSVEAEAPDAPVSEPANAAPVATVDEAPAITIGSTAVDGDPMKIDQLRAAEKVKAPEFFDAWIRLPSDVTPGSLLEHVKRVMAYAREAGLSDAETVALGWHSAARKADESPLDLVEEVSALLAELPEASGSQDGPSERPAQAPIATTKTPGRVHLLTPAEDAALESITWWGDDKREEHFMARMHEINPIMSEPYYRLNRWMILSLIFASKAVIPGENGTMVPLNFYGILLGPSGTGKSESLNPVHDMMSAFYLPEDEPSIGGDATTAGLTQALIRRDGRTSFFHGDEADAVFRSWSESQGAFSGMKNRITDIYGGRVPMLHRTGAKDISGIRATAYLCVHLTGVDERITDAIEPHDWESGFVNRFVWANGQRKARTREQKRFRIRRPGQGGGKGIENWYGQWAAQFRRVIETKLTTPDNRPAWIDVRDEVLDRHIDTTERFEAMANKSPYPERLRPTFTRMETTILKCAALVAITNKRTCVEMEDYLIALEQAEEWTENILEMVEATDESPRARQTNRLAQLIASSKGVMRRSEIHARKEYAGNSRDTNSLIDELVQQGRAEVIPVGKSDALISLTEAAL